MLIGSQTKLEFVVIGAASKTKNAQSIRGGKIPLCKAVWQTLTQSTDNVSMNPIGFSSIKSNSQDNSVFQDWFLRNASKSFCQNSPSYSEKVFHGSMSMTWNPRHGFLLAASMEESYFILAYTVLVFETVSYVLSNGSRPYSFPPLNAFTAPPTYYRKCFPNVHETGCGPAIEI